MNQLSHWPPLSQVNVNPGHFGHLFNFGKFGSLSSVPKLPKTFNTLTLSKPEHAFTADYWKASNQQLLKIFIAGISFYGKHSQTWLALLLINCLSAMLTLSYEKHFQDIAQSQVLLHKWFASLAEHAH